jgi:hypothetical protein
VEVKMERKLGDEVAEFPAQESGRKSSSDVT